MHPTEYITKLKSFNSTDKYIKELNFMLRLIEPRKHQTILDFGCGIGTAIKYFSQFSQAEFIGYDIVNYCGNAPWYTGTVPKEVTKAYLNHSIAHVPNVDDTLRMLRDVVVDEIIINTPNREWVEQVAKVNENYVPDPTVVKHLTVDELKEACELAGFETITIGQYGEYSHGTNERIFYVGRIKKR